MQFPTLAFTSLSLLATALAAPSALGARQTAGWSIRNFTRNCANPDICTYTFGIDTGSSVQSCTTVDTASPATMHAWYSVPCQESSDWVISWGWDYQNDFTVMTVVNEPSQTEAFFGYNHPNAGLPVATYADVGPNAVQSTGA